jgi:acyl-ACP thioesterase
MPEFLDQSRWPGLEEDLLVDSEVESFTDGQYKKDFDVCVTHLDFNNHVNNVCYLEWALNSLPTDVVENYRIQDIVLNFLAEAQLGDTVVTRSKAFADGPSKLVYGHNLQRQSDDQPVAAIRTIWCRRNDC